MLISRRSELTGKINTRDLPVTFRQLVSFYCNKHHLESIFPFLSPEDKEFLKTGITREEWELINKKNPIRENSNHRP
jgi:hypothetical protein